MALRYNSDSDSVHYLTQTDGSSTQGSWSYNISSRFRRMQYSTRRSLKNVPWERVLILLAVNISVLSFAFSAVTFIESGRLNEQMLKMSESSSRDPSSKNDFLASSSSASRIENSEISSGDNQNHTEQPWTQQETTYMIMAESEVTRKWITEALDKALANYTSAFETQIAAISRELTLLQHFRVLTKTEISSVKSELNELIWKQNATWIYHNLIGDTEKTSLSEIMTILDNATSELNDASNRFLQLDMAVSNLVTRDQLDSLTKQLESMYALNGTVQEFAMILSEIKSNNTFQQQKINRRFGELSNIAKTNSEASEQQENALTKQLNLLQETKSNLSKVESNANARISRIEINMQQSLISASRQCSTKIYQSELRLNTAILQVKQDVAQSVRQLNVAASIANTLKMYDSFMRNVNSSLASLATGLKGKADRDWIPAPNRYEYHLTTLLFVSWSDAKRKCEQMGATLACVGPRDEKMQKYLFANIVGPRGESAWIGLTDLGREGKWKWIDGIELDKGYWSSGQPNNVMRNNVDQDCAEIYEKDGMWNDRWCVRREGRNVGLCERKMSLNP